MERHYDCVDKSVNKIAKAHSQKKKNINKIT